MVTLLHIDEKTFEKEEVEFKDKHFKLAESLHKSYKNLPFNSCTPIMVSQDKKSLLFCVNLTNKEKDRLSYENGNDKYRITIEKI